MVKYSNIKQDNDLSRIGETKEKPQTCAEGIGFLLCCWGHFWNAQVIDPTDMACLAGNLPANAVHEVQRNWQRNSDTESKGMNFTLLNLH